MRWNDLPHDAQVRIGQLKGEDFNKAAEMLGITPGSLRVYVWRMNKENVEVAAREEGITFPEQATRRFDDRLVVEAEDAIFISDIHVPNGDIVWLETVLLMSIKHKIKTLFILGDSLDSNQQGISTWPTTWLPANPISFPKALSMLKEMLRIYLSYFENIYILTGNHDQRVAKVTQGQVDLGTFLEDFDERVHFTHYRSMYITNHRGYIAAYHQANFSGNGLALGRRMYNAEDHSDRKPYAVITTHIHHWSCGKSEDGLAEIYSLGASEDDKLSQYANETPSTHAKRSQSMILMKRGYMRNIERKATDWLAELAEYADKASICKGAA